MKKFAVSLLALAALSTASFAADHGDDHRILSTTFGKYAAQLNDNSTSANAVAVAKNEVGALTAFERLNLIAAENENEGNR
jgi:hypothetical protein